MTNEQRRTAVTLQHFANSGRWEANAEHNSNILIVGQGYRRAYVTTDGLPFKDYPAADVHQTRLDDGVPRQTYIFTTFFSGPDAEVRAYRYHGLLESQGVPVIYKHDENGNVSLYSHVPFNEAQNPVQIADDRYLRVELSEARDDLTPVSDDAAFNL